MANHSVWDRFVFHAKLWLFTFRDASENILTGADVNIDQSQIVFEMFLGAHVVRSWYVNPCPFSAYVRLTFFDKYFHVSFCKNNIITFYWCNLTIIQIFRSCRFSRDDWLGERWSYIWFNSFGRSACFFLVLWFDSRFAASNIFLIRLCWHGSVFS